MFSVLPMATSTSSGEELLAVCQCVLDAPVLLTSTLAMPLPQLDLDAPLFQAGLYGVHYFGVVQRRDQVRHHLHDGHVHAVDAVDEVPIPRPMAPEPMYAPMLPGIGRRSPLSRWRLMTFLWSTLKAAYLRGLRAHGDDGDVFRRHGSFSPCRCPPSMVAASKSRARPFYDVYAAALLPQHGLQAEAEAVYDRVLALVDGLEVHADGGGMSTLWGGSPSLMEA